VPTASRANPTTPARRAAPKVPAPCVVLFVRHGRTPTTGKVLPGRAPGLHLAPAGRAQAAAVAQRIAAMSKPPTAIYASPLERTRETAAPIAAALGLRVRTERGLIEVDIGEWTGKSLKALTKTPAWPRVQRWPSGFRFPGGESFAELTSRATDAVLGLAAQHPGETIVAVSHADTIKALVAAAAGVPLDLFQRMVVSPCSVSAIAYGAGGPLVLCVNSLGTLDELAPS
jgi:probable phosphomutase (TIGR03848 family)